MLEKDFAVFSAYGCRNSAGVSLLVGRSLYADINFVFAGWLWPMLPLKAPAGRGLCAQYLFSSVGAVPRRFEAASFNGGLISR